MKDTTPETLCFRPAAKEHARDLAELVNIAGEGIPFTLWSAAAPDNRDPMETGALKAAREGANFCYRNAHVATAGGRVAGMVLAYPLPEPKPGDREALAELPDIVRPMVELEYEVPNSYYVNALAVRPGFRGRGIATQLLRLITPLARAGGCATVSVAVFSENSIALRLYEREGFKVVAERPVVPHPCYTRTDRTLMLVKSVCG